MANPDPSMNLGDPFEPVRRLALRRPPPPPPVVTPDRERVRDEATKAPETPAERQDRMRSELHSACANFVSHKQCPYRWIGFDPIGFLRFTDAHGEYLLLQLKARGFKVKELCGESKLELVEPTAAIPTPDIPAWLTIEAHKEAVAQWKAAASACLVKQIVAGVEYKSWVGPIACPRIEHELVPYMNLHFAALPFEFQGRRMIIAARAGTLGGKENTTSVVHAIWADLRPAPFAPEE